jgi:glyoxylase-like metal-dependent hydrolase (beta-lactamase superfamily II)
MHRQLWLAAAAVLAVAGCGGSGTASSVIEDAQATMGNPASLEYSGTGMNAFFGQALIAGQEWPRRELSSFTRTINYEQRSARDELTFAQPVFGGQQQNAQVSGDRAWNMGADGPVPQPAAAEERQLHIWLTPHGFLKAAAAAPDATLTEGEGGRVIAFTAMNKYRVEGTIDEQNLVTRVATAIPNPVMGDTEVVAAYSGYRGFEGVQFPSQIRIDQGGFPLWELNVTSVTPNAPLDLPVPEAVGAATAAQVQTMSTPLGDGVWHITGGSHHSVLVEFDEYLAVVEAPLNEARSVAVLAEARRLVPNKPVRYVLTTHHHFDHSGGLRTYVAEGATVVTHESNVAFFRQALAAPATIDPDMQGKAMREPMLQGVSDRFEITDGRQSVEVYATMGDTHTGEYTLVYLPRQRILVEGDAYSPGPADAPPPATPPPNAVALYRDIQRLKLNVATIAPIHGRGAVPIAELRRFVGTT